MSSFEVDLISHGIMGYPNYLKNCDTVSCDHPDAVLQPPVSVCDQLDSSRLLIVSNQGTGWRGRSKNCRW